MKLLKDLSSVLNDVLANLSSDRIDDTEDDDSLANLSSDQIDDAKDDDSLPCYLDESSETELQQLQG